MSASTEVTAECHCGLLKVVAPRRPDDINECQCSICAKYGAAWAYYTPDDVHIIKTAEANVRSYIWGDKLLSFNFCGTCGCMLYWWPIQPQDVPEMGINTRNMKRRDVYMVNRRKSFTLADKE